MLLSEAEAVLVFYRYSAIGVSKDISLSFLPGILCTVINVLSLSAPMKCKLPVMTFLLVSC